MFLQLLLRIVILILSTIVNSIDVLRVSDGINMLSSSPVLVQTQLGPIEGFKTNYENNQSVESFLGIPFAEPPVGNLRFRRPLPVKPWTSVLKADQQSSTCPQKKFPFANVLPSIKKWSPTTDISEDCLKLNIWTPNATNQNQLLNVLVFFHGGGFTHGSTSVQIYDGAILCRESQLVIVSFNYRVASFGFMFLDDEEAPGNMGLWDQRLALEWVRDNIKDFGGDPDKVTVFGQSAGAVSISHHLLSNHSRTLFNKAILLSGASNADWAYGKPKTIKDMSLTVIKESDCLRRNGSGIDLESSMECLRQLPVEDVLASEPRNGYDDVFVFKPVVDGQFLKQEPDVLMDKNGFANMDVLVGLTTNEGALFLPGQMPLLFSTRNDANPKLQSDEFEESVSTVLGMKSLDSLTFEEEVTLQGALLEYGNFPDPDNSSVNARKVIELMGDFYFNCAVTQFANTYSKAGNKVHKYLMNHRPSKSLWPKWMGTTHTDDLLYIFGEPLSSQFQANYTPEEKQLSRRVIKYFTNFAKTGNPNGPELPDWPKYDLNSKKYLLLDTGDTSNIGYRYREKQCYFWNQYLPNLMQKFKSGRSL